MTSIDKDKLRFDLLSEELKALNAQENWGTTLFLTTIALTAAKLIDLSMDEPPASSIIKFRFELLYVLPALMGLVGFVFIRVLNYRLRRVREDLFEIVRTPKLKKFMSLGVIGWIVSALPLMFGLVVSSILVPDPIRSTALGWIVSASVIAVITSVIFFWSQNRAFTRARLDAEQKERVP